MTQLEQHDWLSIAQKAKQIRHLVFVNEWRIPEEIEFDCIDIKSDHVILFEDGQPVATGRICPDGYISRVAVIPKMRKTNAADRVFQALIDIAVQKKLPTITVSSTIEHSEQFKQAGYQASGKVYMEAGVARQKLTCSTYNFKPLPWHWLH
jgi:predicted GNAT family N-acyltransferase